MEKVYVRRHSSCPYCKNRLKLVIHELGERVLDETYIRHFDCPYCSRKIEIFMKEYLGTKNQFQRNVDARKPKTVEDGYSKKMLRKIEISMI